MIWSKSGHRCQDLLAIMTIVLMLTKHGTEALTSRSHVEIGQLKEAISNRQFNVSEVSIDVSHMVLDTEAGYVPSVRYEVSLTSLAAKSNVSGQLYLASLSLASWTLIGRFTQVTSGNQTSNDQSHNPINLILAADVNDTAANVNNVYWLSPEVASGCAIFVAYTISNANEEPIVISTEEFCPRTGCVTRLSGLTGEMHSPGYPNRYPDNSNCVIIIEVPEHYRIKLQFQMFYLESAYLGECVDYMTIDSQEYVADSQSPSMTSAAQFCGRYEYEDLRKLSFTSENNFFIIHFRSDSKLSGSGFSAVYYAIDDNNQPIACSEMVHADQMTVTSPYFPNSYLPDLHCRVTISVEEGLTILLKIVHFDLQPVYNDLCLDYLVVEGAMEEATPLCGTYSQECHSSLVYESVSSNLTLTFHTDFAVEASGFKAYYTTVDPCSDETVYGLNGTLSSSNYPLAYPNNQNCTTTMNVSEPWLLIQLQVLSLDTPIEFGTYGSGDKCTTDYLEIFDGKDVHRKCGRWTGKEYLLKFQSDGPIMSVRFVSDGSHHCSGYTATWRAVVNDSSLIACDDEWLNFKDHCFRIVDKPVTWQEAADLCHQNNSYLASITNLNTHQFISDNIRENRLRTEAYWIGANDKQYEADFYWDDGAKVEYEGWFPGWSQHNFYNKQPNDDGFSDQDCVEIRDWFSYPSKGGATVDRLYWNDRSCEVRNGYICQRLKPELLPLMKQHQPDCSSHVTLTPSRRRGIVSSPGYPLLYDNFLSCNITLEAPEYYVIEIEFEDFVLEYDDTCSYDYLMITSLPIQYSGEVPVSRDKLYCGDWSTKTKLLRYVSFTPIVVLTFVTDHSRVFRGFKAKYKMIQPPKPCGPGWYYNVDTELCYNIHEDDNMTYSEAAAYCRSLGAAIVAPLTERDNTIVKTLISSYAVSSGSQAYWLSMTTDKVNRQWSWPGGDNVTYLGWDPQMPADYSEVLRCAVYRHDPLYTMDEINWAPVRCDDTANVICQKTPAPPVTYLLNSTSGSIQVPEPPDVTYKNNSRYLWRITTPPLHRIQLTIEHMDIEPQEDCLYDYIKITDLQQNSNNKSSKTPNAIHNETRTFCGQSNASIDWSLSGNAVDIAFVSDYITTGSGFVIQWQAVEVHDVYVYNESAGVVTSLNYPMHYLDNLDYRILITVQDLYRIYVRFDLFELSDDSCRDFVDLDLGGRVQRLCGSVSVSDPCRSRYLSYHNVFVMSFHSDSRGNSDGFRMQYDSVPLLGWDMEDDFDVTESRKLTLCNINYPYPPPDGVTSTYHIRAPLGTQIKVSAAESSSCFNFTSNRQPTEDCLTLDDKHTPSGATLATVCPGPCDDGTTDTDKDNQLLAYSYLNYLTLKFHSGSGGEQRQALAVDVISVRDVQFLNKTKSVLNISVDTCSPSPCHHDAKCLRDEEREWFSCQCRGPYTGLLCAWTFCDREDQCLNGGQCSNTETSYNCSCTEDYSGKRCEVSLNACAIDYCFGHGKCLFDSNWKKYCECHDRRIGPRCARVAPSVESKRSLSSRLLNEPFWIGIIVVSLLLLVTGTVVLIRKRCHCRERCQRENKLQTSAQQGEETNGMKSVFRRYRTGQKYETSVNGILSQVYNGNDTSTSEPSKFMMATASIMRSDTKTSSSEIEEESKVLTPSSDTPSREFSARKEETPPTSDIEGGTARGEVKQLEPVITASFQPESSDSDNEDQPQVYPEGIDLASGHRLSVISNDKKRLESGLVTGEECLLQDATPQQLAAVANHVTGGRKSIGDDVIAETEIVRQRAESVNPVRGRRDSFQYDQESCYSSEGSAYCSCGSTCSLSRWNSYQTIDADSSCSHPLPHSMSCISLDHYNPNLLRHQSIRMSTKSYDWNRSHARHRHASGSPVDRTSHHHHHPSSRRHRKRRSSRQKEKVQEWYRKHSSHRHHDHHSKTRRNHSGIQSSRRPDPEIADFDRFRGCSALRHASSLHRAMSLSRSDAASVSRMEANPNRRSQCIRHAHSVDCDLYALGSRGWSPRGVISRRSPTILEHIPPPPSPDLRESCSRQHVDAERLESPCRLQVECVVPNSMSMSRSQSPTDAVSSNDIGSQTQEPVDPDLDCDKSGMEARRDSFLNITHSDLRRAEFFLESRSSDATDASSRTGSFNPLASAADGLDEEVIDPSTSVDSALSIDSNNSDCGNRPADGERWIPVEVQASQPANSQCWHDDLLDRSPTKDSAYQSKEASTERCTLASRPTSNAISPTLNVTMYNKDSDQYDIYKALPRREEDKRVTNQLELAAKKLKAMCDEDMFNNSLDPKQYVTLERLDKHMLDDMSAVYPSHLTPGVHGKTRRTFPSRMLSMIMDEESEAGGETPGSACTAVNKSYPECPAIVIEHELDRRRDDQVASSARRASANVDRAMEYVRLEGSTVHRSDQEPRDGVCMIELNYEENSESDVYLSDTGGRSVLEDIKEMDDQTEV